MGQNGSAGKGICFQDQQPDLNHGKQCEAIPTICSLICTSTPQHTKVLHMHACACWHTNTHTQIHLQINTIKLHYNFLSVEAYK